MAAGGGPVRHAGYRRAVGQLLGPSPRSNLSLRITVPTSVLPFTPLCDRVPFPNLSALLLLVYPPFPCQAAPPTSVLCPQSRTHA